jgi:transposase
MLTMTYQYKLQPTTEQIVTIEQTLLVCRSVWNFALRQRKDWCASRKSPVNACSQEVKNRGVKAVGQIVFGRSTSGGNLQITPSENVCGDGLTGTSSHTSLVENLGNRKSNSRELESPVTATKGA